jgi:Putative auto-transporter adhesin, head GIN domain
MQSGLKSGFILFLMSLSATASAALDKRSFLIGDYSEVVVSGDIQVEIANNGPPSAMAEGDAKLVDALKIERNGQIVRISLFQDARNTSKIPLGAIRVKLVGRNLKRLSLAGPGKISVDAMKAPAINLDLKGPGEIDIGKFDTEKSAIFLNGSGRVKLGSGMVRNGAVAIRGTAQLDAAELSFGTLSLATMGSAVVTTKANSDVTISNSGAGSITIGGTPNCIIRQSGSGTINCEKTSTVQ